MNEQEKKAYYENYQKEKEKGIPFYPNAIFKDVIVSFIVLLILVALSYFIGAPLEERANPADNSYTPRPEWYFLFLFQLLKYFPGSLEVLGVVVLPTILIILLFLLPFMDRSQKRHYSARSIIMGLALFSIAGITWLTVQSVREAPPPAEVVEGDQTAALYARNCAGCHGPTIPVRADVNLHEVITQGRHEGMPAWSGDLTSDQIDSLAGFILSPGGSQLFTVNCGECHESQELVAGNPLELKNALELSQAFPQHADVEVPNWAEELTPVERTTLLNFLVAPDGQRLFATNCSPCHGQAVAYAGSEEELRQVISEGGLHLQMPPWQEKLSEEELETLSRYVVDPAATPNGENLFQQNCASCHGERIPSSPDIDQARRTIATGGSHETMPVWGEVLTPEQLDALASYTLSAAKGSSLEVGQNLFSTNCAACHGDFGEGGPNPTRPDDIIAPISTAEYLKTRDDFTLRSIISQGQPNFGMSPFSSSFGGPLEDDEIDAIVSYMRSWEANPPVELPPDVVSEPISLTGAEIYQELCSQCHGANGEGGIGPSLSDPEFQDSTTSQEVFDTINIGHEATSMIAWGEILTSDQIEQLAEFILQLKPLASEEEKPTPSGTVSFAKDVQPIFKAKCVSCHGNLGGWDGSSYEAVMTTGNNAPTVISGDVEGSLLAQKLLGTQTQGNIMPPGGKLPEEEIQVILDWIAAGAPE